MPIHSPLAPISEVVYPDENLNIRIPTSTPLTPTLRRQDEDLIFASPSPSALLREEEIPTYSPTLALHSAPENVFTKPLLESPSLSDKYLSEILSPPASYTPSLTKSFNNPKELDKDINRESAPCISPSYESFRYRR